LLRAYQAGETEAFHRFRIALPAAENLSDAAISALDLKLHDAQSAIAREYGLPSWQNLKNYVDWRRSKTSTAREDVVPLWLHNVYGHEHDRPRPDLAALQLAENPDLGRGDVFLNCAAGDEEELRAAIAADRECVHRISKPWQCPGCKKPLGMPPLVAVTHSTLVQMPEYRDRLHRCARLLLDSGADPNQSWEFEGHPLSALFGAAGKNHDPDLTRMLLDAGANPNDGESLYHSLETRDHTCTRLLLAAGARVGKNILHKQLDSDDVEGLRLLLAHKDDPNDPDSTIGSPLIWAIRRARSREHIEVLLAAGVDPRARTKDGVSAYRFALLSGMTEAAELLRQAGAGEDLPLEDQFVAACARFEEAEARRILSAEPRIFDRLSESQLQQLPNLTESRLHKPAVKLMVELGWPIATQGGDWNASALNLAVLQGDSELARFLLAHGASWKETHGFGDNVNGTLSWASRNLDPTCGDWVGCARALVEHGMPILELDGDYSEQVAEFLETERARLREASKS
jgi:ankyrin repeat protein